MSKKYIGFIIVLVLITVASLITAGIAILKPNDDDRIPDSVNEFTQIPALVKEIPPTGSETEKASCPDPFIFPLPIDINKATSILYPGQVRGGDFKAHGGFRFDNSLPSDILVTAPIDAKVIAGARYPANTGDLQYTFDFEHPCGIRYRLGHLLTLSPKFQELAEKFPLPKGLDSRTTQISPPIEVKKGEVIATAVGMTKNGSGKDGTNAFLDWGVYDYRQKNEASKDPAWAASHASDTYQYAVCWFDWISAEDRAKVLALPSSDYQSGKTSDYCK